MRKWWASLGIILAAGLDAGAALADYRGGTIRIGVLNDQTGLYGDIAGTASVWVARKAVEDFGAAAKGMKVEILSGDHQNKPDIGLSIARHWFEVMRKSGDEVRELVHDGCPVACFGDAPFGYGNCWHCCCSPALPAAPA